MKAAKTPAGGGRIRRSRARRGFSHEGRSGGRLRSETRQIVTGTAKPGWRDFSGAVSKTAYLFSCQVCKGLERWQGCHLAGR